MSVPDFQTIMLPMLAQTKDGQDHRLKILIDELANSMKLSTADKEERLPSGRQRRFDNRVYWASIYLTRAGLIERASRGVVRITNAGKKALGENPKRIDIAFLEQFPEFRDFQKRHHETSDDAGAAHTPPEGTQTPQELLEKSYGELRATLAEELLSKLRKGSPGFFEKVVLDVMLAMGYGKFREGAGKLVGGPGDGGLDGLIDQDKLGLESIALQAKRWEAPVGRPVVQAFSGSLDHARTRNGILVTTSSFTADALAYVKGIGEKKIALIDGKMLAEHMIDHGVGVSDAHTYVVKKIDSDYFDEE
jgi:restriction system protein